MSVQGQVLKLIFERQPISQSGIRALSGHSASAVSNVVKRALAVGLLKEVGVRHESLGRPRTLLSLNDHYAHAVGVQLNATDNLMVLADLRGNVVARRHLPLDSLEPSDIAEHITQFIQSLQVERIIGVGLAVSGIVDADRGVCLDSTTVLGWHDVAIADIVATRTGLPTYVENDANAIALAELFFSSGRLENSFVVLTLGKGIGSGIIVNKRLYRGRNGIAGELGHVRVTGAPTLPCHCGKTGCLEVVASTTAIARHFSEHLGHPVPIQQLRSTIDAHPDIARVILGQIGEQLGATLAALATIFDPDAVCVAMEDHLDVPPLVQAIHQTFTANLLPVSRTPTTLRFLRESKEMWALGAASIAVERFFDSITQELSPPLKPTLEGPPGRSFPLHITG